MRESISLLVVLGVVATGICIPGVAQALEEMVFQFRSQEIGDTVPDAVCERGAAFLGVPPQKYKQNDKSKLRKLESSCGQIVRVVKPE